MRTGLRALGLLGLAGLLASSFPALVPPAAAPGVDYLVIQRDPTAQGTWVDGGTYAVTDSDVFYAVGYNATGGWVGPVNVSWYVDNGSVGSVSPTNMTDSTTFVAGPQSGIVRVYAYCFDFAPPDPCYRNGTGQLINNTGPLSVLPPSASSIRLRDGTGGTGSEVGDVMYYVGDMDLFTAAAYDATGTWVGDAPALWWSSATGCDVMPQGASVWFTAAAPGTCTVTAYYGGLSDSTGILTVRVADYLQIRDAPGGGGSVVGDRTYYTLDSAVFYAAAYATGGRWLRDAPAAWTVDNPSVCQVSSPGNGASFQAIAAGNCTLTANYLGLSNSTGTFTIVPLPAVYVDDDEVCGGNTPCFPTFAAALVNASDGDFVIVYPGTYPETVVVDRRVRIRGLDRANILADGRGGTAVFEVRADLVEISNLTIRNGTYGVRADGVNGTRILDTTVRDYVIGIFLNRTRDAYVARNLITQGQQGVVTDHAFNDAVRWNEISYNTVYGAKDFDSTLTNCFNWNTFHHNKVAYFYDPTSPVDPFDFDGNLLEDNEVGVRVENGPALRLTNNTFRRNERALEIAGSNLDVRFNTFEASRVAVSLVDAGGNVTANTFVDNDAMLLCDGAWSTITSNTILGGATTLRCPGPDVTDLVVADASVAAYDTRVVAPDLQGSGRLSEYWSVTVRVLGQDGGNAAGARVTALDRFGQSGGTGTSGAEGVLDHLTLLQRSRTASTEAGFNPYTLRGETEDAVGEVQVDVDRTMLVTLSLSSRVVIVPGGAGPVPFPWLFVLVGSVTALGVGSLLAVEPLKYALLALFVPLFTRLKRDEVLDHYNRGRLYQYIEMNPGDHFNSIRRALDLRVGTATYHLEVLEKNGLVISRNDGIYKRFYPQGARPPLTNGGVLSEVQMRILHAVRDLPGITQNELAQLMGLRQPTINYQMSRLMERRLVRSEKRGRHVHYHAIEPKE